MTSESSHSDSSLLAEMKRAWSEDLRFYSNAGKEERERWVVNDFLARLQIQYSSDELCSHDQHSKVDVEFRDARFQVKEIPDPNLRRGEELKDIYRRVMKAKTLQDTVGPGFVYDVPASVHALQLVRDKATELALSDTYLNHKNCLDLLCYVTRTRASPIETTATNLGELASLGWRSISYLMGVHAMVLYTASNAPSFLRTLSHGR